MIDRPGHIPSKDDNNHYDEISFMRCKMFIPYQLSFAAFDRVKCDFAHYNCSTCWKKQQHEQLNKTRHTVIATFIRCVIRRLGFCFATWLTWQHAANCANMCDSFLEGISVYHRIIYFVLFCLPKCNELVFFFLRNGFVYNRIAQYSIKPQYSIELHAKQTIRRFFGTVFIYFVSFIGKFWSDGQLAKFWKITATNANVLGETI